MSDTPCVLCLTVGEHHVDCPRTLTTIEGRCGSCGSGLMQEHDESCNSWAMLGKMWALRERYIYQKVMLDQDYAFHMCASCESAVVGLPKYEIVHLSGCLDRDNVVTAGSMESAMEAVREAREDREANDALRKAAETARKVISPKGCNVCRGMLAGECRTCGRVKNPDSYPKPKGLASTRQVGGEHYQKKIQPWDVIETYGLDYFEGNVLKYLLRRKVNRLEDLRKAAHYLEKVIEREGDDHE